MKRFTFPTVILGLVALLSTHAPAVQAQGSKGVAVVNINAVLVSIPEYVTNDSILGREWLTYDSQLKADQAELQKAAATLDQKFVGLTPVERDAAQKKLQSQSDSIQKKADGYKKKIADRRDALLGPIEDRVTAVIEGLRAEGNYSVVLNVASEYNTIVAADKNSDLTAKAIERLKAKP